MRGSEACMKTDNKESEMVKASVGLSQGCMMSPWTFNMYRDRVIREVNARLLA